MVLAEQNNPNNLQWLSRIVLLVLAILENDSVVLIIVWLCTHSNPFELGLFIKMPKHRKIHKKTNHRVEAKAGLLNNFQKHREAILLSGEKQIVYLQLSLGHQKYFYGSWQTSIPYRPKIAQRSPKIDDRPKRPQDLPRTTPIGHQSRSRSLWEASR